MANRAVEALTSQVAYSWYQFYLPGSKTWCQFHIMATPAKKLVKSNNPVYSITEFKTMHGIKSIPLAEFGGRWSGSATIDGKTARFMSKIGFVKEKPIFVLFGQYDVYWLINANMIEV